MDRQAIFEAINTERDRQNKLHPEWKGNCHGVAILAEEFGEAAKEAYEFHNISETVQADDPDEYSRKFWELYDKKLISLKDELVQVAAVAVRWLENID